MLSLKTPGECLFHVSLLASVVNMNHWHPLAGRYNTPVSAPVLFPHVVFALCVFTLSSLGKYLFSFLWECQLPAPCDNIILTWLHPQRPYSKDHLYRYKGLGLQYIFKGATISPIMLSIQSSFDPLSLVIHYCFTSSWLCLKWSCFFLGLSVCWLSSSLTISSMRSGTLIIWTATMLTMPDRVYIKYLFEFMKQD